MYRTLFGILGAVAVALLVVGLTFSSAKEDRADFVFINATEPKNLDPHKFTGQPEGRVGEAIFEGLTFNHPRTLRPTPGCAESWEVTPDGKRWTFRMRPGVVWSNGDPVTAHDFVYSWVRLQEPSTAAEYAYLMHMVRHAEAYNTYAAHVDALRGPASKPGGVLADLDALLAKSPRGMPAKDWQAFADESHLRDFVTRTKDAVILGALAREQGEFTPAEGTALRAALAAEAERRAAALAHAQAHFGKDEGVFAPDDHTFVVELNAYTPYFMELTCFYPTLPVHRRTVEAAPDTWFLPDRIVSNGPFLLESWQVNRKIRLRKNPRFWEADKVQLETVDVLPIDNRTTSMNVYLTGEADWGPTGYPPDLIDQVKRREDFYIGPGMVVYYYRFNCTRKPFDDPRVRKAIGLAFDRTVLVEEVLRAGQLPATTIVAPGVPDYVSPPSALGLDVELARRLLAEAGFPDGQGFPKSAILFNTDEGHKKIAEYIARQLKKNLGIDIVAKNEEWQSYQESTRRLDYQIARAAWIGDYRDPNTFLDMWLTKGGNNQTGWGDPFYDRLIALAADPFSFLDLSESESEGILARFKERPKAEEWLAKVRSASGAQERLDAAAGFRLQLFREAEALLFQDAFPICPIYFYTVSGLVSPRLEGFYRKIEDGAGAWMPNLQDMHPFRYARMLPEGQVASRPELERGAGGR